MSKIIIKIIFLGILANLNLIGIRASIEPDDYSYNSFVEDSKIWEYEGIYDAYADHEAHYVDFQIVMEGDTCIDNVTWKNCWFRAESQNAVSAPVAYIREENHKVYLLPNTNIGEVNLEYYYQGLYDVLMDLPYADSSIYPVLLYDFDLETGGTLLWPWIHNESDYYDEGTDRWYSLMQIEDTDYGSYCGKLHKIFKTNVTGYGEEHVDGIGIIDRHGVFFRPYPLKYFLSGGSAGNWNYFTSPNARLKRVTTMNDVVLYDENHTNAVTNRHEDCKASIRFDRGTINFDAPEAATFKLYNANGECLKTISFERSNYYSTTSLTSGIYLVTLEIEGRIIDSLKFIMK